MKVGDFAVCDSSPFGYKGIVKIISKNGILPRCKHISYKPDAKSHYDRCDTHNETNVLVDNIERVRELTLEECAVILKEQPLIRASEKANFADFLKQKLIEEYGIPPTSVIERPVVAEGEVSGFIRINNT